MSKLTRSTIILAVVNYLVVLPGIAVGQTWQVKGQEEVLKDPAVTAARMELQTALPAAPVIDTVKGY